MEINIEITGVCVCYNTKDLVKRAYESVRSFHPDMSIIIVDNSDTSSDGASCRKYTKSLSDDKTSVVFTDGNIGHGRGLVVGLSKVNTPFALLFDSDIEMLKSPVQAMFDMMEEDTYGVGYTEKTAFDGFEWGCKPIHQKQGWMKYLHPYFCLIQMKEYKKYRPFIHHGAPAVNTMLDIYRRGLSGKVIKEFPGLGHSSGVGWVWKGEPRGFIRHDTYGTRAYNCSKGKKEIEGAWDKVIDSGRTMVKITCITCTGDRPEAFELLRRWIKEQTVQPDQWLVIDDGKVPLKNKERFEYIRREPKDGEGHTLNLNMKTVLPYVKGDIILIMEDDDWYGPEYISTMSDYLQNYNLVGEKFARYYHLPAMKYSRLKTGGHASLCQTGFTRKLLPLFEKCLEGNPYIDARIWGLTNKSQSFLITDAEDKRKLHCSMKGLKGRKGIGSGHDPNSKYYSPDKELEYLIRWVGEASARIYLDHIGMSSKMMIPTKEEPSFIVPSTREITVITCTGDRPEAFVLLQRWMDNQTVKPTQWIVVDDGKEPLKNMEGFEYIRREPTKSDYTHTLCLNIEKAMAVVRCDKIIIMEDDDWYDPTYIDYMSKLLDKADLVGFGNLIFYYPSTRKYMKKATAKNPAFAQTAFKRSLIPVVQEICRGASKEYELCGKGLIDMFLWKHSLEMQVKEKCVRLLASLKISSGRVVPLGTIFQPPVPPSILRRAEARRGAEFFTRNMVVKATKLAVTSEKYISVGMKGMPGRKGLTTHHNIDNRKYKDDVGGSLLKSILKEDAILYQKFFT